MSRLLTIVVSMCVAAAAAGDLTPWHLKLELGNGGIWQRRIEVTVTNSSDQPLAGQTVELKVGKGAGEIDLVDARAGELRACNADGTELLWRLVGPDGKTLVRLGTIEAGSRLILPVEAEAKGTSKLYVYVDNPGAWPVPDVLEGKLIKASAVAAVGVPEAMRLRELPAPKPTVGGGHWMVRAQVPNFSATPLSTLVQIDVSILLAQGARGQQRSLLVTDGRDSVPAMRLGESLLFSSTIAEKGVQGYHVTLLQEKMPSGDPRASYLQLLSLPHNLVKNADFEADEKMPAKWDGQDGKRVSLESPGLFGKRCARLTIEPQNAAKRAWFGLRQDVPLTESRRYLIAAWIRTRDVEGKPSLHLHWRTAKGELTRTRSMGGVGTNLAGTNDWTMVQSVVDAPADAAVLQLHLTHNGPGTIWHDGVIVAPVTSALVGPIKSRTGAEETGLAYWPVPGVVKVFREDLPPARNTAQRPAELRISAARNEAEPLQVALRNVELVKQVKAVVEAPVGAGGAKLPSPAIAVVGYVPIDHKTNYYRSEAKEWQRRVPTHGPSSDGWGGWWPDPLLPRDTFDLEAQTTQPIWVTFQIPENAAAGDYRGKIRLVAAGNTLAEIPLVVQVHDFAIPKRSSFKAVYDVRGGGQWTPRGGDAQQSWRELSAFMARRRLSPDRVSPEPVIKYENGQVITDFTEYDKAAEEYFNVHKHPHTYTPRLFYSFGWAHPPKKFMNIEPYEGTFPYENVDRSKLRPAYKQAYQACLKAYLDHMKEKGWSDRVLLYVSDEPHFWVGSNWGSKEPNPQIVPQMKAVCEMIREVDPKLPIYSSTWWHTPSWDGVITAWGLGFHGIVTPGKLGEIKRNARVLWTTDGHMCTDTPYCAVERLLPHFCFKYGVEGYEFWGATWLTYDPYQYGWHRFIKQAEKPGHDYYIRYPNGDGYLIYPGAPVGADGPVSSVRLEQARDGVEDYEYLVLLRDRIAQAKGAGKDVSAAAKVLEAAQELVTIPNAGGRFSTKLLPDPARLSQVREDVAKAIEGLGR